MLDVLLPHFPLRNKTKGPTYAVATGLVVVRYDIKTLDQNFRFRKK